MTYREIKSKLLSSLASIAEGQVYMKVTTIPSSYPSATYQFTGFESINTTDTRSSKGFYKFSLFILEDVSDYSNQGDVWIRGNDADTMELLLKEKLEALMKVLMQDRMISSGYDIYPGQGDGGRDLMIGRLDIKARATI